MVQEAIQRSEDLQGLKIRFYALGGQVLSKLGAQVSLTPGGEIFRHWKEGS